MSSPTGATEAGPSATGASEAGWLRTAHLLTGDPAAALRLVAGAVSGTTDPRAVLLRVVRTAPTRGRHHGAAGLQRLDGGVRSAAEQAQDRWRALGTLPVRQRAVLVLRAHSGLTATEVAELLGVAEPLVELDEAAARAAVGGQPHEVVQLLVGHADDAPCPDELGPAVRARRRRRSRWLAAAAVVVALAGLGGLVTGAAAPGPVDGVALTAPLPDPVPYRDGGELAAQARVDTAVSREVAVPFTPTALPITLATSCTDTRALQSISVDGRTVVSGGCGAVPTGDGGPFTVGRTATVTFSVTGRGTALLAVYQRVPLPQYPFPPRPDRLAELPPPGARGALDSRTVGATGEHALDVVVEDGQQLEVHSVAPGAVRLLVDGRELALAEFWDWEASTHALSLAPATLRSHGVTASTGQVVRVTVQATGFAVPGWTVAPRDG
jgi:hypothetical protein